MRYISLILLIPICTFGQKSFSYDVVIYGGTSAAISAAVQVKSMGKSVVVVSPDKYLGGLSSSGLGWTDSGKKEAIGGLAREFYHRVWRHYQSASAWKWEKMEDYGNRGQGSPAIDGVKRTMWIFEPHVAELIFDSWVQEHKIEVFREELLDRTNGVLKKNGKILSISTLSGNVYEGSVFLDCTYEGDLMAASGVSYFVGRESNSVYGETLSGVQTKNAKKHQFKFGIDPFVVEGDPSSGLLARISGEPPGVEGSGDTKMQAYNFRLCLTQVEKNRIPFPKPDDYDPSQYELLLRTLNQGSRHVFGKFDPVPNSKTDTNNHGPFSTDNIGMNYLYPEASYEDRKKIILEHEKYQKGYFYFLCNDPRVPEDVSERMSEWGLAKDEFQNNDNWPHQIYVREARRMIGEFVTTELHLRGSLNTKKSVGMGSYNMDSHHVQRYVAKDENGKSYVLNEGDIQINPGAPYQISYDSLVPQKGECENLLVPVCVSTSHIAFGSIRMEPVFMILAQSAATAAVFSIDDNLSVQDIPYEKLKKRLILDNQILELKKTELVTSGLGINPDKLSGLVVDGSKIKLIGDWVESTSLRPFVGSSYFHDGNGGKGMRSADFPFIAEKDGLHEIKVSYVASTNRAGSVIYEIEDEKGLSRIVVDQRKKVNNDNLWHSLGSFVFKKGKKYELRVKNDHSEGYVIVDAAHIIPLD
ncbi:MAG: FAD-dependent oxidoreductase [Opitutae bacterium]|nr:FAD-dependent oxidoreductase [Opitutae bacterium]